MIVFSGGDLPTPAVEIERRTISEAHLGEFLRRIGWGDAPPHSPEGVPISYTLALRREHGPEITVVPQAFAIHGGHDIELVTALSIGHTYVVSGCVEQIFEKTGRSGPMTVVGRRIWIHEASSGALAATIRDHQIVRWRPQIAAAPAGTTDVHDVPASPDDDWTTLIEPDSVANLEVGDVVGPFVRGGPSAEDISSWAGVLRDRETLFHDPRGSRELGYANLVVPGPLQSAVVDRAFALGLPKFTAVRLDMTFRQSLLADQPMAIEGVVVDSDAEYRTCDIIIRRGLAGEITSAGSVLLRGK